MHRFTALLLIPLSICIVLSVQCVVLLPMLVSLDPQLVKGIEAYFLSSDAYVVSGTGLDAGPKFDSGQVLVLKGTRMQMVVTEVVTGHGGNFLYRCLVDQRYQAKGQQPFLTESESNLQRVFPGAHLVRSPHLDTYFSHFDPETASYVPRNQDTDGNPE